MNYNEINEDINFWTGTDTSSGSLFDTSTRRKRINQSYREVNQEIWKASSEWEYDDSTFGTLPIALNNLEAGQGNYKLPVTAQKVMAVSVLDKNGDYKKLDFFDQSQLGDSQDYEEFLDADGFPRYVDVMSDSIELKPAPKAGEITTTNGLKVHVSRDIAEFTSTSSTREPGFNSDFHQLLSLIPAYDFSVAHGVDTRKSDRIKGKINELKDNLHSFYGNRTQFREGKMIPRSKLGGDGSFNSSI